MTRPRSRLGWCWPVVLAALVAPLRPARAWQMEPCTPARITAAEARRVWPAPLDRPLSLDARDLSLRTALDRLAATGRFRLSYASEYLPLDRRVCDRFTDVAAGDALTALLRGTSLQPTVAGAEQVVLAPQREAASEIPPERRRVDVLERIVVTGSATGTPQRGLAVGVDVVPAPELTSHVGTRLDRLLDNAVPGVWLWEQSPSNVLARYGSIRGASSFGVSYPKIYLDGIEVANPLLITDLGPGSISHIEVIRGPQGAALYGTDAISGVINVVSRHDGVPPDGHHLQLRSRMGMTESEFAPRGVLAQEHALSLRGGSGTRSAGLSASLGTMGDFLPDAFSRRLAANGDARLVGARGTLTATARLFSQQSGAAVSPLLTTPAYVDTAGAVEPYPSQSVRQYTLGATGTLAGGNTWTHRATVGLDGYRLHNLDMLVGPLASSADSALRAAHGGADRATVRVSSVAQVGTESRAAATFTIAAEHSALREQTAGEGIAMPSPRLPTSDPTRWRSNSGLTGQMQLAWRDALYLTGGARLERSSGYVREAQTSLLPMLGAAVVHDVGATTVKLRTAYGRGIRPVRATLRPAWMTVRNYDASSLAPEEQSGIEGGLDVSVGRAVSLHLTRFDQTASGLIQSVAIPASGSTTAAADGAPEPRPRISYQLQNVGEISNRGWELQANGTAGPLSLGGTLSLIDSRVERVMSGYGGELRAGDRMLEVPARTASVTAGWTAERWNAALSLARASDWINYDRTRLSHDAAAGDPHALVGARLRDYWRRYDGVTRLGLSVSRVLFRDLTGTISGDNLLGQQRGEPDDVTVVPGRTVTAGVRVRF